MAISTTLSQPCAHCGQRVDAVLHKSFVIEDDASLRTILENRFHVLDCASCGERRAFEADFLVTNKPRDMFVQVIVKDADVASMRDSFRSMLDDGVKFARIVPGRQELVEKVKLWHQKLDDVAMEVTKFLVRIRIGDKEGKTQRIFDRIEGDDLVFRVRAPGQAVELVKMPLHIYRDAIPELDTAAHARDYEVDERLARKLMEQQGGMPAAKAPAAQAPAAQAPAAQAPAAQAPAAQAPAGAIVTAPAPAGARVPLKVTHAGSDRRGRRFVSDGKLILLADLVTPSDSTTPMLLTTETMEGFVGQSAARWSPIVDLVRSKVHAACYRTPDDVALGENYVQLLLSLGKSFDLGTSERLGPVLVRDGGEIVGVLMPLKVAPELAAAQAPVPAADEDRAPCPICKGMVPRGERFCEACGACLAWQQDGAVQVSHPELASGRVIVSESFENRPFPGRTALEESRPNVEARVVRGGKMITYQTPITASYVDYARTLRDACVRATFTPLDPGARIGLCARHSVLGNMQIYYLFDLMPLAGRAWCSRGVQSPDYATSTRLCPEAKIDPVPLGTAATLELRVAGPTLRAFLQGRQVLVAHDAAFGAGAFGIRVGREHDISHPVRIVCHGYELREVMP